MAVDYRILGQKIQARRKKLRRTQENMAESLAVTTGYVSQIERGITKVNLDTLSKIAETLGCDITEFLGGTTEGVESYLFDDVAAVFTKLTATNKRVLLEISEILLRNQDL